MWRFVVVQIGNEWMVTYEDRTQTCHSTREEAETSAFGAADAAVSRGCAVSVLIVPDRLTGGRRRFGPRRAGSHPVPTC